MDGGERQDAVLVRRYPNRRLYDTSRSCYVALEEIVEVIRAGREVRVVDSKTGEDVTRAVLAQVVVQWAEQRDAGPFSAALMHRLIRAEPALRTPAGARALDWVLGLVARAYGPRRGRTQPGAASAREGRGLEGGWAEALGGGVVRGSVGAVEGAAGAEGAEGATGAGARAEVRALEQRVAALEALVARLVEGRGSGEGR